MSSVARIAITPGEPAGIGPDLCVMLAQQDHAAELVAVADPSLLQERAARRGLALRLEEVETGQPPHPHRHGVLKILPRAVLAPAQGGRRDPANAV